MDRNQKERFQKDKSLDFAVGVRSVGRFRVSAFMQRGTTAPVFRAIVSSVPQFEMLGLPEVIRDLS